MGEVTAISWCRHTFNPWIGCTKVSVGNKGACEGCYAEVATPSRVHGVLWGNHPRHRTAPSTWAQPLAWNRRAEAEGTRPFVFCASLADVFDNQVDPQWRCDLFDLIRATPHLVWLLLTKRPQNIVKLFRETILDVGDADHPEVFWPDNAAIGCTVVTQEEADRDIPHLLRAKAALNPAFAFLSMEPLLGPVDLRNVGRHLDLGKEVALDALTGDKVVGTPLLDGMAHSLRHLPPIDWVITGGETDQGAHKARPADPDWYRSLRDQCAGASIPYHHKQNGEWCEFGEYGFLDDGCMNFLGRPDNHPHGWFKFGEGDGLNGLDYRIVTRVGKKRAGRLLDGVLHDAMPEIRS